MKPFFSIIVPVYNVEKQLNDCVESVINQTFKDYEVLLIDDGSKDKSSAMCNELQEKYSCITAFHKENGGLSDARNYGIDRANGQFLLFIDSDDVIDKNFCKVLYEAHVKHDAEIVSTGIVPFFTQDELEELKKREHDYVEHIVCNENIIKTYFSPSEDFMINHGLCMKSYKAELFSDLRFEKGRLHEDLFITYQLLDKCKKFVYIDLPYYYYFQNTGSITHNYSKKNFLDEVAALKNMINYFAGRAMVQSELLHFITNHYFYLVRRCSGLKEYKDVIKNSVSVGVWIKENIKQCDKFSFVQKSIFSFCATRPNLYLSLIKIYYKLMKIEG